MYLVHYYTCMCTMLWLLISQNRSILWGFDKCPLLLLLYMFYGTASSYTQSKSVISFLTFLLYPTCNSYNTTTVVMLCYSMSDLSLYCGSNSNIVIC